MLSVAAKCVAAALCSSMTPQAAQPHDINTLNVDPVAAPVGTPADTPALTEKDPAEEDPPASTSTDATETETIEQIAPAPVSIEEITPVDPIVMVSQEVIQPLDISADIEVIATPIPPVIVEPSADEREIECLALNIYHEARGEPTRGRYAVAWVTINRMHSSAFPDTVCEVVYQKAQNRRGTWVAQFSWILQNPAEPRGPAWTDSQRIAAEVYAQRNNRSGTQRLDRGVMYYHATSGVSQRNLNWFQRALRRVVTIGDHIFYTER